MRESAERAPAASEAPFIRLRNVAKTFTRDGVAFKAVTDASFDVRAGEFVCMVGPSGCGKSTLLRILAGLVKADEGSVVSIGGPTLPFTPGRDVGIAFQQPLLL